MFSTLESSTIVWVVHIDYGQSRQNQSIGIYLYSFGRAFHGASFEKNPRFYHFLKSRYMRNKRCCNHFGTPSKMYEQSFCVSFKTDFHVVFVKYDLKGVLKFGPLPPQT